MKDAIYEVVIGVAESGGYIAASTASPYFCFEGETEDLVKDRVKAAICFYHSAKRAAKESPVRSKTTNWKITKLFPTDHIRPELATA